MKMGKRVFELAKELHIRGIDITSFLKSKMLGKVLGSKVAVESYLLDEMPELKEWILLDSDKAIIQFTEPADIARQYQTRAMAEYKLGNYENAVKALKKAAGVTDDNLMMLVRTFKEKKDEFGLMHYANIMALATAEGSQLGKEMYEAWEQENVADLINELEVGYPKYVIQWRVATTRCNLGASVEAGLYYRLAMNEALKDINVPTIYAAGLAIQAEYCANIQGTEKQLELLKVRCAKFMGSNIPETMGNYFEGWDKLLFINNDSKEKKKQELLMVAKRIPIL